MRECSRRCLLYTSKKDGGSGLAEKMLSTIDFDGQRNFKYDESGPAWFGADGKSVEYDGSGLMEKF